MADTIQVQDEYAKIIELHKCYLEVGIKTAAGSFAIIGGVVAFVSNAAFPEERL